MISNGHEQGSEKHFMPDDITALIPRLEAILDRIDASQDRAEALSAKLELILDANRPSEVAQKEVLRAQVEFIQSGIRDDVNAISSMGGVLKDVTVGLVDFPGVIGGLEVWLCWKRGETKVGYWHTLDTGFSQRQAVPPLHPDNDSH